MCVCSNCRYPAYVLNRLGQLSGATGEDAVQRVSQLLYLSTLMCLYLQNSKDLSKKGECILHIAVCQSSKATCESSMLCYQDNHLVICGHV